VHKLILILIGTCCLAARGYGDEFLHNGVTAHRGNSGEFPENTLPAFESGIKVGADWLELDIFKTADGKLVVVHDRTTKRVGDIDLDVTQSSYEELLAVDVATGFRRDHNLSVKECPKHTMPLLEDVLQKVMTQNRTRVSIQPKMDCVGEAVALIKRLKCESWVGFNDGNLTLMAKVKKLAPELPVFWDRGESDIDEDIAMAKQNEFEALVLNHAVITQRKVENIHRAGLEVGAWTVNSDSEMKRLLELGVNRIYTDYPKRLLRILRQNGQASRKDSNHE